MPKILFLASLTGNTGNNTTALRIAHYLRTTDCHVDLVSVHDGEVAQKVRDQSYDAIIGIHAYRAGRYLQDTDKPIMMIFGGTDLNEHVKDAEKLQVMTKVINKSHCIIAFSPVMLQAAASYWPDQMAAHGHVIYPAIPVPSAPSVLKHSLRECLSLSSSSFVLLLPCGIRPVKDPLWLKDQVDILNQKGIAVDLVVIGPSLDAAFFQSFVEYVESNSHVHYLEAVPQCELYALMQQSDAILNSSLSEGLSNVILETMHLLVPLIVRNIPGNTSVVEHKRSGFVLGRPEELSDAIDYVRSHKEDIVQNASEYVHSHHSIKTEQSQYQAQLRGVLGVPRE